MAKRRNSHITSIFNSLKNSYNPNDLGFGDQLGAQDRLINRDGSFNIVRTGLRAWSPYQSLVELSWASFFLLVVLYYVLVNAFFGVILVYLGVENISGSTSQGFWQDFEDAFFFSIQTFTSVGYGVLNPANLSTHTVSAVVALVGNISFAMATGLFFARFSKPKAQLLFSNNALLTTHRHTGEPNLQFRLVNLRNNKIINLEVKVVLTWLDDRAGKRHYKMLPLERDKVALFPLNWTIVHTIDQESPLHGKRVSDLVEQKAEIIIQVEGFDETFAQNIHMNSSYTANDLVADKQFVPMYYAENGKTILELDKIHEVK